MMINKNPAHLLLALVLVFSPYVNAQKKIQKKIGSTLFAKSTDPVIINTNMSLIPVLQQWQEGDPIKESPIISKSNTPKTPFMTDRGFDQDELALKQISYNYQVNNTEALVNIDGANFTGSQAADTNGDIGINHYVQTVNDIDSSQIRIFDKTNGTTVMTFKLGDLALGTGSACVSGEGDPIVFFDQFASNKNNLQKGRWVLTEFTSDSFCIYVSQTADPTSGSWFLYEFESSSGGLPDYPKFGNWHDAYYVGTNENPNVYAFDKENMIMGETARPVQFFDVTPLPRFNFQHIMPADADGQQEPPAGSPGIFMRHRDGDYHDFGALPDVLELFEFNIDWENPQNSILTGPISIEVTEFDSNLGGTNFNDLSVTQPSGSKLLPLKQPLMWRLQHRTIGAYQYIVGNMVTDVNGQDLHGIRWFQLQRATDEINGGWILFNEGTYTQDDTVNRWMASTAMDKQGNIAIGFNVSNKFTYPGIRYTGRKFTDPFGVMSLGDNSIIEGTFSNGSFRWGDYSSLSVDPVDGCTFWYTAQYNKSENWSTRIASFKIHPCGLGEMIFFNGFESQLKID